MKLILLTLSLIRNLIFNSPVHSQEINLQSYCKDGYYQIPGEMVCSRAPYCGGYGYDELNTNAKMKDYNACMGNTDATRAQKGCGGYVPLCCYEMARTGDFTKCIGYWERNWCSKSQCDEARANGANENQCPGGCGGICGHASESWCHGTAPVKPLAQRLGNTTPQPTSTIPTSIPNQNYTCPTTSTRSFDSISVKSVGDNRAANQHPDKNIEMRGYVATSGTKNLVHNDGPKDSKAPQLSTVLSNLSPSIIGLYQVYDWNWGSGGSLGSRGSPLTSPWDVTMIGLLANPGDQVHVPAVGYSIGSGYNATVLYADLNTITIKYTGEDSIAGGYAIQYDDVCVDPNLVNKYNQLNRQGRSQLPALKNNQTIGTAKTNEVKVAVRDTGTYMDPRSDDSWWIGMKTLPTSTITPDPGSAISTTPATTPFPTSSCQTPPAVVFTAPPSTISTGSYDITWIASSNTIHYAIRIDDKTNPWKNDCSIKQNTGDVCADLATTSYKYTFQTGHSYHIWVHALNDCGGWDKAGTLDITVPANVTSCSIQGLTELIDRPGIWNSDISTLIPTVQGFNDTSYTINPYLYKVPGNATYTLTIPVPMGYTVGSTFCTNKTDCHKLTDSSYQSGSTRANIYCPAGGYADVNWHFKAINPAILTPTISLAPGKCLGVQHCIYSTSSNTSSMFSYCGDCSGAGCDPGYTCKDSRYTCQTFNDTYFYTDQLYAVPCDRITITPTPKIIDSSVGSCTEASIITWAEDITRTTVDPNTDKINLHWNKIPETHVKIEVSTDEQQTWTSKLDWNNEYFDSRYSFFVSDVSDKKVYVRLQAKTRCDKVSSYLYTSVLPVSQITKTPLLTPTTSVKSATKEIIIGGALLVALIGAAILIGS